MSTPRLGYGTYGLQDQDVFQAIPRLAKIGYRALELTIADGWPTAPKQLTPDKRAALKSVIQSEGFTPPVLMDLLHPFAATDRAALQARLVEAFQLVNDLHFASTRPPIYTTTLGDNLPDWETGRDRIVELTAWMADLAKQHGVVLALEPHVGGSFDRPEKAVWLMRALNHPNARLNLDVSHFLALGLDIDHALELLVPHAVFAHIKDVVEPSAKPRFVLPGQGAYDLAAYFQKLRTLGYDGAVTVEVSGQIWKAPGYQPWEAAQQCFDVLTRAAAGQPLHAAAR